MREQDSKVLDDFDRYCSLLVESIRNYIEYARDGVRRRVEDHYATFTRPLLKVKDTIDMFIVENIESVNEIKEFINQRDIGDISQTLLEDLLNLEQKIEVNRNYTINPEITKFDTYLGEYYFDETKTASFLTDYSNHYSAAYTPILEKVCFDWLGQLSKIFDDIDSHSWIYSDSIIDESLVDHTRKRLPAVKIDGLSECYSSVKLLMGKFIQIERATLNCANSLGNNPNSVKYMQAMLKSLPLTVTIRDLSLALENNDIDESKFIDICRQVFYSGSTIMSFPKVATIKLNLRNNILGDTSIERLMLALRYLKNLIRIDLDISR